MSIIAATIYLLVSLVVYSKRKENPVNKSFLIMLLCVSIWLIDVAGIIGAPNPQFAEIWGKIFRNGLLFSPSAFLHFSYVFTHPEGILGRTRKILISSYAASCFFAVINWTPYFTAGVKAHSWGYHVQSGPLYFLFVLQFTICIILSLFYLIRGYIGADSYQRHRLRYFFLALVVSSILGGLNFLPMFGVEFSPLRECRCDCRPFHCDLFRSAASPDGRKRLHGQRAELLFLCSYSWGSRGCGHNFFGKILFPPSGFILLLNRSPNWDCCSFPLQQRQKASGSGDASNHRQG